MGTIWNKMVKQFGIEGRSSAKFLRNLCTQAKNATLTRNGMSPEQAVFGRSLRWPLVGTTDEDDIPLAALGTDGEAWLASQIRAAVRMALLSRDASDKIRRATLRRAPGVVGELAPGTRIYFWSPHPSKGRQREDALRWRGPATVIARESVGRYYVGWRSRVLLVAKDQIRMATMEEAAASDTIAKDLALTADKKYYQDMTGEPTPPPPPPRRRQKENVVPQVPAMPLLRDMPEAVRALEIKEREIPEEEPQEEEDLGELAPRTPPHDVDEEDRLAREQIQARGTQELARAFGFGAAASRPVEQKPMALMDYSESSLGQLSAQKRSMLDDVPNSIKKYKVGAGQLAALVMFATKGSKDSWFTQEELDGLSCLVGFHVTGARVHRTPRRRLYDHDRHGRTGRLTLMCTDDEVEALDDGAGQSRSGEKRLAFWTGMTIFYEQRPKYGARDETRYIDTPVGLVPMKATTEELANMEEIFVTWGAEPSEIVDVHTLEMKNNMKELNPKTFGAEEKEAFDEADAAEWKQWLASGAVALVPRARRAAFRRTRFSRRRCDLFGRTRPRRQDNCRRSHG